MSRSESESLLGPTESFFHRYLQNTRGAIAHAVADLALDDVQSDAVLALLDHVESPRGNSSATRNCRLASVRSFDQHPLRQDVTRAGQYGRSLRFPTRKSVGPAVYLEPEEARAAVSRHRSPEPEWERDHALLLFALQHGGMRQRSIGSTRL